MLIVADGAPGLIKAVEQCWPASDRQHCSVHRARNLIAKPVGQEHLPSAVDLDPLQGRRSSKVLVARNRLLKSTFRLRMRVAADTIVQSIVR